MTTPRERRAALCADLRGPLTDWEWDFSLFSNTCGAFGCALGRAKAIGLVTNRLDRTTSFDLTLDDANAIFGFGHWPRQPSCYGVHSSQVTPAMVADALEAAPYASERGDAT
jgi:hypothetical protein